MTHKPLITVVMATFNEPPSQVSQAINSIVSQTYQNWELLLLDDSTNEPTIQAIDSFAAETRIRIIRGKERLGFVKSLNKGLLSARGEYVARMDGDDISLPQRLELQVSFLEEHPDISVAGSSVNIIDGNDSVISSRVYPTSCEATVAMAMFRNPLAHPTVMFRKSLVDNGYRYDERLIKAEDVDLWLRLIGSGHRICNLPQVLLHYRVVGDLSDKRRKDNWKYNLKVRAGDFSLRRPFFSMVSVVMAFLYLITPEPVVKGVYRIENNSRRPGNQPGG